MQEGEAILRSLRLHVLNAESQVHEALHANKHTRIDAPYPPIDAPYPRMHLTHVCTLPTY